MAASKFFYLDSVGLDKDAFLDKSLDSTITSNNLFNIGINNLQTQVQFEQHQKAIQELLKTNTSITFKDLNFVIESYLLHLLSITSISNLEKSKLSPHFSKYSQVQTEHLCKRISVDYLEDLTFTNSRVWGGEYGSSLYSLYLEEEKRSYLHPSQITEVVINSLNKFPASIFSNIYSQLSSLSFSDDSFADELIYRIPLNLITSISSLKDCYSILNFFAEWLPKVIDWYLEPLLSQTEERIVTTEGEKILEKIAQKCLYYGLDSTSFKDNLSYSFIHQDISISFLNLFEDILSLRKSIEIGNVIDNAIDHELVKEFIDNISINTSNNLFRETSLIILRELCPPGGYNLLLILTSLSLLNRAYILSHSINNPYSALNIFPLEAPLDPVLNLVGRVLRLIYVAGFTLTKSNLEHLNITGFNLMHLTNLNTKPAISSKDLLI